MYYLFVVIVLLDTFIIFDTKYSGVYLWPLGGLVSLSFMAVPREIEIVFEK